MKISIKSFYEPHVRKPSLGMTISISPMNRTGGVMVNMFTPSLVDCGFVFIDQTSIICIKTSKIHTTCPIDK